MKAEQIILKPITTRDYPDPTEARRSIRDDDGFYGYDYVFLEDATRNALCEIAHEPGCTVDGLCCDIDLNFAPYEAFAPAARRSSCAPSATFPTTSSCPETFAFSGSYLPPTGTPNERKTTARPVPDAELAKTMAIIKRGLEARVGELRRDLAHWIGDTTTSADHTPVSIALLETAIDRYLDTHDEADARDLIERIFRRAVQRHRGTL